MTDYEFEEGVLESAFDIAKEYMQMPRQPNEFTVTDMAQRYPQFCRRHWNDKLDKMVEDGKLLVRRGKANVKLYREPDDD